jgi:hypothetical protein
MLSRRDLSSATLSGKAARRATTRKVVLDIGEKETDMTIEFTDFYLANSTKHDFT